MLCHVFSLIERLDKAVSVGEITMAIGCVFGHFGFEHFTFQEFPDPKRYAEFVFSKRIPDEWFTLFNTRDYVAAERYAGATLISKTARHLGV